MHLITDGVFIFALMNIIGIFWQEKELSPRMTFLLCAGCTVLMLLIPPGAHGVMRILTGIPVLLLMMLFRCKGYQRFLFAGAVWILCLLSDLTVCLLVRNAAASLNGLIRDVAALTAAFLCRQRFCPEAETDTFQGRCFLLTAVGTAVTGLITVRTETTGDMCAAVLLLGVSLLHYCSVERTAIMKVTAEQELRLAETACCAYRNQLQIMNESQQKLRYIRHDMKRHMLRIREMADTGNCTAIAAYLDDMDEAVTVPHIYSRTGNREVDSLINYALTQAEQIGTEILCEIDLPAVLEVTPFDMTVIFGNLLDNALEALCMTEQRQLSLSVKCSRGVISAEIRNSFDAHAKREPDGNLHGIGLQSVRNALENYHGCMHIYPDEDMYRVTVSFFNTAPIRCLRHEILASAGARITGGAQ